MALRVIVSDEAIEDVMREIANLAEFDIGAAMEFDQIFRTKYQLLADHPEMYPIRAVLGGIAYRSFVVKSREVFFHLYEDSIIIERVFGVGQNWEERL